MRIIIVANNGFEIEMHTAVSVSFANTWYISLCVLRGSRLCRNGSALCGSPRRPPYSPDFAPASQGRKAETDGIKWTPVKAGFLAKLPDNYSKMAVYVRPVGFYKVLSPEDAYELSSCCSIRCMLMSRHLWKKKHGKIPFVFRYVHIRICNRIFFQMWQYPESI